MNIKQLVAAVTVLAATGAAFSEARPVDTPFVSTKTRAEVRAELEQARAAGFSMMQGDTDAKREWSRPNLGAAGVAGSRYSGRTREEVRAELEQARAEGLLMTHGERDDLSVWDRTRIGATGVTGSGYSGRTRAEVRAEAIEHAKKFRSGNDELYGK